MLLTEETTPEGEARIYATQLASVVTYFADDGEGGTVLFAEPGEFACRWSTTQDKLDAVRDAVLVETAHRLNCPVDKVLHRSLADIALVTDPLTIAVKHTWSRRRPGRRPGR